MNTQADIKRYIEQAECGDTEAMRKLGIAYFNADGIKKDSNKAEEYLFRSVWGGNIGAAYNMAYTLVYKENTSKHCYNEAFFYALHGAKAGNTRCQHLVAIYYMGEEKFAKESMIPTNWYTANIWYQKAAEQGYAGSMHNLGLNYRFGRGCVRNMETAIYWWNLAAEKNFMPSVQSLANAYHGDYGWQYADANLAGKWIYEMAKSGDEDYKKVLDYYYRYDDYKKVWKKIR